jgi:hypothetical protein
MIRSIYFFDFDFDFDLQTNLQFDFFCTFNQQALL